MHPGQVADRSLQALQRAELVAVEAQRKRRRRQLTGMLDRVVEDMILASMASGQFRNLKGAGKPLPADTTNPYVDGTEQKVNRILRDNGFCPAWILKESEVRTLVQTLRHRLRLGLARRMSAEGEFRFDADAQLEAEPFAKELNEVNRLINDYNLIAPSMSRQLMPLSWPRELDKARASLADGLSENLLRELQPKPAPEEGQEKHSIFKRIVKIFY